MAIRLNNPAVRAAAACTLPGGRQGTPGAKGSCVYRCAVGDVQAIDGRLVSISDNPSCCPQCDAGAPCVAAPAPFPWFWVVVAGFAGYYMRRRR